MGNKKIKDLINYIKSFFRQKTIILKLPKSFKTEKQKMIFIKKTETLLNKIIEIDYDR
tara:strand:+ start:1971 stop:2144 length:174 start_codon:yes stop_codon:yes gene_type:complete